MNGGASNGLPFDFYASCGEVAVRTHTIGGSVLMEFTTDPVELLASLADPNRLPRLWAPTPESFDAGSWVIIDRPSITDEGIKTETR